MEFVLVQNSTFCFMKRYGMSRPDGYQISVRMITERVQNKWHMHRLDCLDLFIFQTKE